MSRAERVTEAQRLRASGLTLRQTADAMGVSFNTIKDYVYDPDHSQLRARKDSYRGLCEVCGGPTDGTAGPGRAGPLCQSCRDWSAEECIEAIQRWARSHGGIPPSKTDWARADVDHPVGGTVERRCGGWNTALLRAGFGLRCDRRPETQQWIEEQLRAGVRTEDIADQLGMTRSNIYMRLKTRGLRVGDLRTRVTA